MWLLYLPPVPPVRCRSVHDLPSQANGVSGVWLSGEPEVVIEWLCDIRRQCSHAHLPIFVDCELPASICHLHDGMASCIDEALKLAMEWRPSAAQLQTSTASPVLALVRYLYLRPLAALAPQRDCRSHQAYRYPLLEAFSDGEEPAALLATLLERGWLEQAHLVDRLRRCESCRSTHLNYVDVCPECAGLQIEQAIYIHCFTCSHMAPQEKFIRGGALLCPNCHSRLRHIGADYNRPLEQMRCKECAAGFSEPEVVARCLSCGHDQAPERLPVLNVASYTLSDSGRQAARQATETAWHLPAPLQTQDMMLDTFIGMTEWMMSLARRHDQASFTLLGLYLEAPAELEQEMGEDELHRMLDAFAGRLRELMRDTDILTRVDDHLIWIALPQTSPTGGKIFLEKILALSARTRQESGSQLQVRGVLHAVDDLPEEVSAEHLLNALGNRLQRGLPC
jgi:hypothetical protein